MPHTGDHPAHRTGYPSLTGIRGFAAAIVFLNHVGYLLGSTSAGDAWRRINPISITGVICFFVLSGFLLAQPGSLRGGPWDFWRRRGARILPVYWLALTLSAAYLMVRGIGDSQLDLGNLVLNLLLMQSWSPQGQASSINLPAWSLSVELLFYLLIPLALPSLRRLFVHRPWGSLVVVVATGLVGSLALQLHLVVSTLPLAYMPIFLLGVHAAVVKKADLPLHVAVPAAALGGLSYPLVSNYLLPSLGFMVLIASLASRDRAGSSTWLAERRWRRFGEWSYAFFLLHVLVIAAVAMPLGSAPTRTPLGLGACLVAFLASWVLAFVVYRWCEEPARIALSRSSREAATGRGH